MEENQMKKMFYDIMLIQFLMSLLDSGEISTPIIKFSIYDNTNNDLFKKFKPSAN